VHLGIENLPGGGTSSTGGSERRWSASSTECHACLKMFSSFLAGFVASDCASILSLVVNEIDERREREDG
jgi:hypothetical protein